MSKPIIFNTEMVRAILAGRKTQTRRVVKMPFKKMQEYPYGSFACNFACNNDAEWFYITPRVVGNPANGDVAYETQAKIKCPYGQVGDTLWVRETFCLFMASWTDYGWEWDIDDGRRIGSEKPKTNDWFDYSLAYKASYEGDDVNDCYWRPSIFMPRWASRIKLKIKDIRVERLQDISDKDEKAEGVPADYSFKTLWDSINAKRGNSWESNPYVWVVEFDVVGNRKLS